MLSCPKVQHTFSPGASGNLKRAEAIREAYVYAWNSYAEYAYGKDELRPLNKDGITTLCGWGLTIVDAIDTAIIMNLTNIVARQLAFIERVDFT